MTVNYNRQADAHLTPWLKAKFNLTTEFNGYLGFGCWVGDYDLDCPYVTSDTRFDAALEFAACYDGALFDKLNAIELGA